MRGRPEDRYQTAAALIAALDSLDCAGKWNAQLAEQWWTENSRGAAGGLSESTRLEEIFFAVIEKTSVEDRRACLIQACRGDAGLQRKVERLLERTRRPIASWSIRQKTLCQRRNCPAQSRVAENENLAMPTTQRPEPR